MPQWPSKAASQLACKPKMWSLHEQLGIEYKLVMQLPVVAIYTHKIKFKKRDSKHKLL